MKLVSMLKTTPLWLLLPLLMFVGVTAFAVSGYEPLVRSEERRVGKGC